MCSYLHISMIPFLFWPFILPYLLVFCVNASKGSQKSKREVPNSGPIRSLTTSNSAISSESEEKSKSERSTRSMRNSANDSLKVSRKSGIANTSLSNSGKSSKKSLSSKSQKGGSDTDSAKTELIEVPLGKAAKDCQESSILTPAGDQKTVSFATQLQKVTFADNMKRVKARGIKRDDPEDEKTLYIP